MINLPITTPIFLNSYWQKKSLIIRQAIPHFSNPITADELAGLSLEADIESRIVIETPGKAPYWHLKRGPFLEAYFTKLPKTHWTLLVQGVDRIIPDVAALLHHFYFIPQWRIDDVMISYAVKHGSVGPHYDNYDVFLYQASGRRKWLLTTKNCEPANYMENVELRIMKQFTVEEELILEAGDMLYLPAHIGHHGISLSDDCMTFSFGYRSYSGQELLDSFSDYLSQENKFHSLYVDPNWENNPVSTYIPKEAWKQAQQLLKEAINNEQWIKAWFGGFVTRLDTHAEQQLPPPMEMDIVEDLNGFLCELNKHQGLERNLICRFAYQQEDKMQFFVNGMQWAIEGVHWDLIRLVAEERVITIEKLGPFLKVETNQNFLYELWQLQFLVWLEE